MHVLIFNPESGMIDSTTLLVDRFTVASVFDAMHAEHWYFQPGVYVAIKVSGPDSRRIASDANSILTFTVQAGAVFEHDLERELADPEARALLERELAKANAIATLLQTIEQARARRRLT